MLQGKLRGFHQGETALALGLEVLQEKLPCAGSAEAHRLVFQFVLAALVVESMVLALLFLATLSAKVAALLAEPTLARLQLAAAKLAHLQLVAETAAMAAVQAHLVLVGVVMVEAAAVVAGGLAVRAESRLSAVLAGKHPLVAEPLAAVLAGKHPLVAEAVVALVAEPLVLVQGGAAMALNVAKVFWAVWAPMAAVEMAAVLAGSQAAAIGFLVLGCLQLAAARLLLLMGAVARDAVPAGLVVLEFAEGVGLQLAAAPVTVHLAELLQLAAVLVHLDGKRT